MNGKSLDITQDKLNRMKQVVIENPILNSPFEEPERHFKFAEEGSFCKDFKMRKQTKDIKTVESI